MSTHDKELIAKADKIHYTQWMEVEDLMQQAQSTEARERLRVIKNMKYHREEYYAHLL